MPTRRELLCYLKEVSTWALTYHNHKELSAWGVVVLYLLFIATVGGPSDDRAGFAARPPTAVAVVVLVLLGLVSVGLLRWQLHLRSWAADVGAASKSLASVVMNTPPGGIAGLHLNFTIDPNDPRRGSNQFPVALLDEVCVQAAHDTSARFWLALGAYSLIIIALVWGLARWLRLLEV